MAKKSFTVEDLKKHHFWIITGVIVLLCLVPWFISTRALKKDTTKNVTTIKQTFTKVDKVKNKRNHPNATTHAKMEEELEKHRLATFKAWDKQYKSQEKQLKWIPELANHVQNMLPVEKKVPFPSGDQIPLTIRSASKIYVQGYLKSLATSVNSIWDPDGKIAEGAAASGEVGEEKKKKQEALLARNFIKWDANSQKKLQTRYDWQNRIPSTLQVLYAQEDVWILEALMAAIARTNQGSTDARSAIVREIIAIDIAEEVRSMLQVGRVRNPDGSIPSSGSDGAGGSEDMGSAMMQAMGGGNPDTEGDGGGGGSEEESLDPADKRYVDNNGKQIEAARLRAAYESKKQEDAFLAVAKRVPVRFRVKMDLHKVPVLLAACGNSSTPIWIRQVRVNVADGTSSGAGGGGGGMESMMRGGMGGGGGLGGPGGGGGSGGDMASMMSGGGGAGGKRTPPVVFPHQQEVELYGVVYIYNPPDKDILGEVVTQAAKDADKKKADGGNAADDKAADGNTD